MEVRPGEVGIDSAMVSEVEVTIDLNTINVSGNMIRH